jgi:hypothetical protein
LWRHHTIEKPFRQFRSYPLLKAQTREQNSLIL